MPDFFIPKTENDLTENIHIVNFALETPPEIDELLALINSISNNTRAYIVGGSVRDSILSAKTGLDFKMKDFDIEVYGVDVESLISSLKSRYSNVSEVGKSFGVLKVKIDGIEEPVDIALPRIDTKSLEEQNSKRGRGIVSESEPNLDLVAAVKRRDLTINSILYDPLKKQIIDPFGGWFDLMNGVIKVTDPETFQEDPLRVLRLAQFAARFGFKIDDSSKNLCKKLVIEGGMDGISSERIKDEIDKLLIKGFQPSIGLRFLQEIGYLEKIMPEVSILETIPQEQDYHPEGDVFTHTMQVVDAMAEIIRRESEKTDIGLDLKRALMLGSLFHDLGKATKTIIDETGRIRSHGHEEAGVPIAEDIIRRIYKNEFQSTKIANEDLVLFFISEHMAPLLLHKESLNGTDMTKAIRRFLHKCSQKNVNVSQISWIVEADKRGRNAVNRLQPLPLESKPELIEAINWFLEISKLTSEDITEKNVSLIEVPDLLNELNLRGFKLKGGPWIKIILKCIELDYIDQEISKYNALERALLYFDLIFKDKNPALFLENKDFWAKILKSEDPRQFIKNLTN
jgi:tRNA nucleotidyltransferase (CCA-adding enzyme)